MTTLEATLRPLAEQIIASAGVPGLAIAAARGNGEPERLIVGKDAAGRPLAEDTLFAIASITKLATGLVALRLVEAGVLELDAPLGRYVPDAVAAQTPGVSLRTLLSHTSGMPLRLEEISTDGAELDWHGIVGAALRTPLEAPPLTRVQYSNPGYALIGIAIERVTGRAYRDVLAEQVLGPLGIEGYLGVEPPRVPADVADVRGPGASTPRQRFTTPAWRALGLPWAGLVTTLDGALALVRAFRGRPAGLLRPETLAEATRNQAGTLGGGQIPPLIWPHCPWGLGPELRDRKRPHWAPEQASPDSFGHAGVSGTLAWADPEADVAWAILGTRTADSGWLIRHATKLGAAILAYAA